MKIRKNIRALLLSAIAICGSMFPAYAASGVTSGSMSIAGTDAKISTITMDGDRTFEVLVANDSIDTHESGKSMVSRAKDDGDVVAAINGGFFNMKSWAVCNSMIQDGKMISCGGLTHAVGITYGGEVLMDKVTFHGLAKVKRSSGSSFEISSWSINRVSKSSENTVSFLNQYCKDDQQVPSGGKAFIVEGGKITKEVEEGVLKPTESQDILVYNAAALKAAEGYNTVPAVGDSVTMGFTAKPTKASTEEKWQDAKSVMGGAASLVLDGKDVCRQNDIPAADQQPDAVNQKIFVAKMKNGEIILGTVRSSYANVAKGMIDQGAVDVIAMDGGGSSMLYSDGSYLLSAGRQITMGLAVVDKPNGMFYGANTASAVKNNTTYESASVENKVQAADDAIKSSSSDKPKQSENILGNGQMVSNVSSIMDTPANTKTLVAAAPVSETKEPEPEVKKIVKKETINPGSTTKLTTVISENKVPMSATPEVVSAPVAEKSAPKIEIVSKPTVTPKTEATIKTEPSAPKIEVVREEPVKTETPVIEIKPVSTPTPTVSNSNISIQQPSVSSNGDDYDEEAEMESLLAFTRLAEQNLANQDKKSGASEANVPTEAPTVTIKADPVVTQPVIAAVEQPAVAPVEEPVEAFGDNENVTRGAFCDRIINAIKKKSGKSPTELAQEKGYQPGSDLEALVTLEILTSVDEYSLISRKEAAVAVYRSHSLTTGTNSSSVHTFQDCEDLSEEETFAISYVVGYGMMLKDDNIFDPYVAMTGKDLESIFRNF